MSIADELQRLQELKSQGVLSEQEFADAKAAVLRSSAPQTSPQSPPPVTPSASVSNAVSNAGTETISGSFLSPRANAKAAVRLLVLFAVLGGGGWFFIRQTAGEKSANRLAASLVKAPIELTNSIETIKASSWTGKPLSLPYDGTLTISLSVTRGNPQVVHLMQASEIESYRARKKFRHFQEFEAEKSKSYKRSGRVAKGQYYLVIEDPTLGILSASSSDVAIKVDLNP